MGRRAFLRGQRLRRIVVPYRPPWAMAEALFTRACTRCGACVTACPTGLLAQGMGGFPEANFQRAHCTFCADCAHACTEENVRQGASSQPTALAFSPDLPPWALQATVSAACLPHRGVLCRSCEGHCAAEAIRFVPRPGSPARPDITESRCTGCGECVASCPVHAISMQAFPPTNPSGLHSTPFPEKSPQ
ncbi:MAG: ferredoxin-type protein NapF [Proteobacteria bacterium]|nr:ferredoxin-type protein NapF [Pseudomonadota bacterium]